jgi:hypothetical protein
VDLTVARPAKRDTPLLARWYPWAGAAALALAAGGVFAWQARDTRAALDRLNQDSESHAFSEAEALDRRGRRQTILADVGFGVAGGCAIAAAVLAVIERRSQLADEVAVVPTIGGDPGAIGMAIELRTP